MCIRGERAHTVVWKAVEFFEHKPCLFGTAKSLRQPLCPRGHLHSSRSFPLASHLLSSLMVASLSLDRQPAQAPGKETPLCFYYLSGKPTSLFIEEHKECQADNNQAAKKPNEQHKLLLYAVQSPASWSTPPRATNRLGVHTVQGRLFVKAQWGP